MLEFIFDRTIQRYRYADSGKFVGQKAVENLTVKAIVQVEGDITTITNLLIEGKINVGTWEDTTKSALKNLHSWNYLLGVGGEKQMTQADYGALGQKLKQEYKYLRGLAKELIEGTVTEAQLRARMAQYTASGGTTHELGRAKSHQKAGYFWEKRIRTKMNSCESCYSYAEMLWQPIGTLPEAGQKCECRSNCGCYKVFSRNSTKPGDSILEHGFGWLGKLSTRKYGVRQTETIRLIRSISVRSIDSTKE
jgi:hypothetical protein